MEIVSGKSEAQVLEYRNLLPKEWGEVEFSAESPSPLFAIKNNYIIGGLSYSFYAEPSKSSIALWVNTLYVSEEFRNKGLGSMLVKKAMRNLEFGNRLFVLTEVPDLYAKLGWFKVVTEGKNTIMKYENT